MLTDHDLYEYAVSCGEGTLLAYGVSGFGDDWIADDIDENDTRFTIIAAPAGRDCATGK